MHRYIEEKLGRPVFTHELASKAVLDEIRAAVKPDFLELCNDIHDGEGGQDGRNL